MSTLNSRRRKLRSSSLRQVVQIMPEEPPMTVDLCSLPEEDPSCIDLTNEPDDIVDLTLINDTPIVCLETVSLPVSPVRLPASTPVLPISSSRRSNRKRPVQGVQLAPSDRLQQPVIATPPNAASTSSKSKSGANDKDASQPKKISVSCPICFDTMKMIQESNRQLVSTICGHIYCSTCLNTAIRSSHACPNCRKRLTLKQYHPIFI